jgi:hypothetical protein
VVATRYDIEVEQGSSYHFVVTYRGPNGFPVDLTGYGALMQVRTRPGAPVLVELTHDHGIELFNDGRISVTILGAETTVLTRDSLYDIVVYPLDNPDDSTRAYEGTVKVRRAISLLGGR